MAAVYGREIDRDVTTFGTTGFTFDNTFLVYDRASESVWYPMDGDAMTAISGKRKGQTLPFLAKPERMTLAEWRAQYPDSLVLSGRQ